MDRRGSRRENSTLVVGDSDISHVRSLGHFVSYYYLNAINALM